MKRHTVECACERGGDCTRTTMCAMDSALQDQADEYDVRIEELEGLLMVARCPNKSCDNKGTMFDGTNIEPCRWCDERTAAIGEQDE